MDSALKHILCFILIYKLSYVLPKSHHQLSLKSMQSGLSPSPNTANGTDYHSLINNVPSTDQMSFNGRAMPFNNNKDELYLPRTFITKFKHFCTDLRIFFKKFFKAYNFWAPELGFSGCMAKYAWFKYPIIPETTIRILGTARTMITDVVGNVQKNIFKDMISERQRIGSMVKETAADDFHTYTYVYKKPQNSSPFAQFAKYPNAMIAYGPTGMNSRMDDVLGVLDEINVKSNVHRPNYRQYRQIRLANTTQQIKLNPTSTVQQANPTKPSQFRIVADDGDEIKNFKPSNRNNQIINKHRKSEMRSQYAVNNGKVEINEGESKVNRQYTLPKPEYIHTLPPGYSGINTNAIVYNEYPNNPNSNYGSPAHLTSSYLAPSYNGPAAEYGPPTSPAVHTYGQPGGIGEINVNTEEFTDHKPETNKGGWLMVDLERIILEKFGLLGSAKHVTVLKCGQYYAAGFIWRTLAELMDKGL